VSTHIERETGPFTDTRTHLRAELDRLDVVLAAYAEGQWREYREDGTLTDESVARALSGDPPRSASASTAVERATARLDARLARTATAVRPTRLSALTVRLDIARPALDVFVAALAPAVDPRYGRIYGSLRGTPGASHLTVDLVTALFEVDSLSASPVGASAPLVARGLIEVGDDPAVPRTAQSVTVPGRVVTYLCDEAADPPADSWLTLTNAPTLDDAGAGRIWLEGHAVVDRFVSLARDESADPPLAVLAGRAGTGRSAAATLASERLGRPLVTVPDATVLDAPRREALRLEALLWNAVVCLRVPAERAYSPDAVRGLLRAADGLPGPVVVVLPERPAASAWAAVTGHATLEVEVSRSSVAQRREHWERQDLPAGADPAALAAAFRLPPGGIDAAMDTARRLARSAGDDLSASHVLRGARAQTGAALADLADRIDPRYTWDDIVLAPDVLDQIRETAAWLRHGGRVYEDWGFDRRFAAGRGLTALFSGPSGTGKTMAAEVLAGSAGLELYRVDLSTVVDKYVGETESNLGRVFDAAADVDAVLLFDEADALFGSRSAVSDAQDRYANVEVNYLLQRIEAHEGPVVLTTNLKGNIDEAFLRRIDVGVDFRRPDRTQRATLWRLVFPDETPVETLDIEYLAGFEVTGGTIENVARAAAFHAADDGADAVAMTHVVHALRRELQKHGRLTTADDFGDYATLVESDTRETQ
jgi:hypothetical protein